jgi:hypothetical protein
MPRRGMSPIARRRKAKKKLPAGSIAPACSKTAGNLGHSGTNAGGFARSFVANKPLAALEHSLRSRLRRGARELSLVRRKSRGIIGAKSRKEEPAMSGTSGIESGARAFFEENEPAIAGAAEEGAARAGEAAEQSAQSLFSAARQRSEKAHARTRADVLTALGGRPLAEGGAEVHAPAGARGPRSGKDLAKEFAKLAEGLVVDYWGTEATDEPFYAFSFPMPATTPLTEQSFRAALRLPATEKIRFESADDFFRDMQDPERVDAADLSKYRALEAAMRRELTDLRAVIVGGDDAVEAKVYLVGRARDGSLSGLEAKLVWT